MLRANNTLSPHLVSTLCRLRFVPTLCPYALSNAKAGAAEVHQTRPIVLVLEPRNCRHCRYCRYCRRAGQASACPRTRGRVDARPSRGCDPGALSGARRAASRDGVAPPVLARLCRSCPTQCGADIPVCAVDSDHTVARNLEGKSAALPSGKIGRALSVTLSKESIESMDSNDSTLSTRSILSIRSTTPPRDPVDTATA